MKKSKLQLKTETVRALQPRQLSSIAGGAKNTDPTAADAYLHLLFDLSLLIHNNRRGG